MARSVFCFLLAILFFSSMVQAQQEQAESIFNQGLQAFVAQDYHRALHFFMRARELGLQNKRLPYNLGVTHYKLQNYQDAYNELQIAAEDPQLADIANYNMGLAAYKLQNENLAIQHFRKSLQLSTTPQQRQLAMRMLNKLSAQNESQKNLTASHLIKFGFGYNDNVTLQVDGDISTQLAQGDNFISLYMNSIFPLIADWSGFGGVYSLTHTDLSDYNYHAIQCGVEFPNNKKTTSILFKTEVSHSYFGADQFQNVANIRVGRQIKTRAGSLVGAYFQYNYYNSENELYDYLQGKMQQLTVFMKFRYTDHALNFVYSLEDNQRSDYQTGSTFSSYSPLRNILGVSYGIHILNNYYFDSGFQIRRSDYPEANVIENVPIVTREDTRYRADVKLLYRSSPKIWLSLDYEYLDNQSNIQSYIYKSNNIMFNVMFHI